MLAHVFDPAKHSIAGWYMSEKYDGMRAFWDSGITRGMPTYSIPYANTEKDGRYIQSPKATGLWSRYFKPIQAPAWFLDELPKYPLDGELYMGPGTFQQLMSTCRRIEPRDEDWERVTYQVFDLPDLGDVFRDGNLSSTNFTKSFEGIAEWLRLQKVCAWTPETAKRRRFETAAYLLAKHHPPDGTGIVRSLRQEQLPFSTPKALPVVEAKLEEVVARGGEGLMLRNLNHVWEPQRTWNLLKVKPFNDCEVKVRGYVAGRETEKGSKLLGLMGAMVVDFRGKRLELSGFTDAERQMTFLDGSGTASGYVSERAGKELDVTVVGNPTFPVDSTVTIRYRELTHDGLPKEARFWRRRPEEA